MGKSGGILGHECDSLISDRVSMLLWACVWRVSAARAAVNLAQQKCLRNAVFRRPEEPAMTGPTACATTVENIVYEFVTSYCFWVRSIVTISGQ